MWNGVAMFSIDKDGKSITKVEQASLSDLQELSGILNMEKLEAALKDYLTRIKAAIQ